VFDVVFCGAAGVEFPTTDKTAKAIAMPVKAVVGFATTPQRPVLRVDEEQAGADYHSQSETKNRASAVPIARAALRAGQPPGAVIRRATPSIDWLSNPGPREAGRKNRLLIADSVGTMRWGQ
jgi:hypothetical protein